MYNVGALFLVLQVVVQRLLVICRTTLAGSWLGAVAVARLACAFLLRDAAEPPLSEDVCHWCRCLLLSTSLKSPPPTMLRRSIDLVQEEPLSVVPSALASVRSSVVPACMATPSPIRRDVEMAKRIQSEIDLEVEFELVTRRQLTQQDEEIARRLQQELDTENHQLHGLDLSLVCRSSLSDHCPATASGKEDNKTQKKMKKEKSKSKEKKELRLRN